LENRKAGSSRLQGSAGREGFSLRDVVFVLFRRRWIILSVCVPIILVGGINLFRQTGSYTASSRVVVELAKPGLPQWNTSGRNIDYDRELSTLFNIAMSVSIAEKAAGALVDSAQVIKQLDRKIQGKFERLDLRDYLLEGLSVNVVGESNILEFQFSSPHPRISLMAVGALRDAFINYEVHGRRNPGAIVYYQEQMKSVRSDIDSLLARRGSVLAAAGYTSLDEELKHEAGQQAEIQDKLLQAQVELRALRIEHGMLQQYIGGNPRDFPMGKDQSQSHPLVYWRNTVAKREDELNSVLSVHTADSLPARRAKATLDGALESLRQESEAYVRSLEVAMSSLAEREASLKDQLAAVRDRNSRAPQVYQQISLLDTEINSLRDLLENLQGKWGEVRMAELADERVSSVVALTAPELDTILSGGKTVVYFVVIFVFAIALGVVAGFIVEGLDHRIYAPRDVEDKLHLPVFASVTKVD